jgi:hypothetical protein
MSHDRQQAPAGSDRHCVGTGGRSPRVVAWRTTRLGWVLLCAAVEAVLLGVLSSGPMSATRAKGVMPDRRDIFLTFHHRDT